MGRNYIITYGEDEIMEMEYDPKLNYFVELSEGVIMDNIYEILEPWKIQIFKAGKEDRIFDDRTRTFFVHLFYIKNEDN